MAFIVYLSFPIFVIILFSFNQTRGGFGTSPRVKTTWLGFTTEWYGRLFELPDLTASLRHSLTIGLLSALAATALGDAPRARARPIPFPWARRDRFPDLPEHRVA